MDNKLWEQATKLANRLYDFTEEVDTLSNGKTVYLLRNRELPGCKAQGSTLDEAKANLDEARIDYIYALLESGLEVPAPASYLLSTKYQSSSPIMYFDASNPETAIDAVIVEVAKPQNRTEIQSLSWQGDFAKQDREPKIKVSVR